MITRHLQRTHILLIDVVSVFQAADWNNVYAVFPSISVIFDSNKYHKNASSGNNRTCEYGYKAFLIHQRETDTDSTPMDGYRESLNKLIAITREDASYDLVWIICISVKRDFLRDILDKKNL